MAALVLLDEGFETVEAFCPVDILRRGGVKVTVAGKASTAVSGQKVTVQCDTTIAQVKADDYDVIVLPGGMPNAKLLGENPAVVELVKAFANKCVAAICASPALVLAKNGLLPPGSKATCYPAPDFESLMGEHMDKESAVVVSGKHLITARGPGSAPAFGLAVLAHLKGDAEAKKVADAMLIKC